MIGMHGELTSASIPASGWIVSTRRIGLCLLLAVIYFLSGKLGLLIAIPPGVATPVWPPSGLALAAVLLLGARTWPGIWLGSFVLNATLLFELASPDVARPLLVAAGIASGSAVQPLLGAWLLRRSIGTRDPLARSSDVLRFVALACVLACMTSATVGVTSLWLGGMASGDYTANWFTWWMGDAGGVLILTPLLLSWNQRALLQHYRRWLELAVCLATVLVTGTLVFSAEPASMLGGPAALLLLIPCLLWAAFRFGVRAALAVLVVIAGLAVWGTASHEGPFALESLRESHLLLESFLGVASLTTLFVGAAVTERRATEASLRKVKAELESTVQNRTHELLAANASLTAEIAERNQAEKSQLTSRRMLESLSNAQLLFIKDADLASIFGALLGDLLKLSESKYGFIGRVLTSGDGRIYLKTEAITDIAWNEETRALFDAHAPTLEFFNLDTLFGRVMTSGEPVIANSPATDPRRGGLPGGHPPLNAFLGLPIHHGQQLSGMVGIANRPGGYDQALIDYLRPFLTTCASIFESVRGDEERRRVEAENLAMERRLQESQRLESLGVLAGGIAHDFNNILTGVMGYAALAQDSLPPGASGRDHLGEVVHSAQRAADLCSQMLAYSGRGRFKIERLSLNGMVDEILHLLRPSLNKKAELRLELSQDLPVVEADPNQMRQVLMNLLLNASEALGEGGGQIQITTGVEKVSPKRLATAHHGPQASPGRHVFLSVTDTGSGMSAETKARIFEPFFTTKFAGRGMGLSAVLGIVRSHRGALEVESHPGRGSSFRLLLPCAEGTVETRKASESGASAWRGHGTVLVVDDEPAVRDVCTHILGSLGFEVLLAGDGLEGIERFRTSASKIVAVLLDQTMPKGGGVEVFAALRGSGSAVPVILMSGYDEVEAMRHFARPGPDAFLHKPFLPSQLEAQLRALFE